MSHSAQISGTKCQSRSLQEFWTHMTCTELSQTRTNNLKREFTSQVFVSQKLTHGSNGERMLTQWWLTLPTWTVGWTKMMSRAHFTLTTKRGKIATALWTRIGSSNQRLLSGFTPCSKLLDISEWCTIPVTQMACCQPSELNHGSKVLTGLRLETTPNGILLTKRQASRCQDFTINTKVLTSWL